MAARAINTPMTMPAIAPPDNPLSPGFGPGGLAVVGGPVVVGRMMRKLNGETVTFLPSHSVITKGPLSTRLYNQNWLMNIFNGKILGELI